MGDVACDDWSSQASWMIALLAPVCRRGTCLRGGVLPGQVLPGLLWCQCVHKTDAGNERISGLQGELEQAEKLASELADLIAGLEMAATLRWLAARAVPAQQRGADVAVPAEVAAALRETSADGPWSHVEHVHAHNAEVWCVVAYRAAHDASLRLATGSLDATLRRWLVPSLQPVGTPLRRHRYAVRSLAVAQHVQQTLLVSASSDASVVVWNDADGSCVRVLALHTQSVVAVAALPGGEVASASCAELVWQQRVLQNGDVRGVALCGALVATLCADGGVTWRDAATAGVVAQTQPFGPADEVLAGLGVLVTFHTPTGELYAWREGACEPFAQLQLGRGCLPLDVVAAATGGMAVLVSWRGGRVHLVSLPSGSVLARHRDPSDLVCDATALGSEFVALATADGMLRLLRR